MTLINAMRLKAACKDPEFFIVRWRPGQTDEDATTFFCQQLIYQVCVWVGVCVCGGGGALASLLFLRKHTTTFYFSSECGWGGGGSDPSESAHDLCITLLSLFSLLH